MKLDDPELHRLFQIESAEYLQRLDEGLAQLEAAPDDHELLVSVFRDIHSLKGAARMLDIQDVETLAHAVEEWLGAAKRGQLTLDAGLIGTLHQTLGSIRALIDGVLTDQPVPVDLLAALERLHRPDSGPASDREASTIPGDTPDTITQESPDTGLRLPDRQDLPSFHKPAAEQDSASPPTPPASPVPLSPQLSLHTIRVDAKRLDTLLTQANAMRIQIKQLGEHLNDLPQLSQLREDWARWLFEAGMARPIEEPGTMHGSKTDHHRFRAVTQQRLEQMGLMIDTLTRSLSTQHHRLECLLTKLEDNVRTARLLPFSTLFRIFPRMVRELAPMVGKQATLALTGGEVLVDKLVIEGLKDPFMHLIRNALDHGIEPPGRRLELGKPPQGTITLTARQTATHTLLEIRDDGRGLDCEAILAKAKSQGLLPENLPAPPESKDVYTFIFLPGFSTSATVSHLSGRGIGMDVVRAGVEALQGTIQADSNPHEGTVFRIKIPSSLTTNRILLVEVSGHQFGIPLACVEQTLEVPAQASFMLDGHEAMLHQGRPVFLSRLSSLLNLPDATHCESMGMHHEHPPRTCLILSTGDRRWGILVDTFAGEEEVVMKPLGGLLQRVRNVAGSAILKNGRVCMVLHPDDLMATAMKHTYTPPTTGTLQESG